MAKLETYVCKHAGLRIVIEPKRRGKDSLQNVKEIPGKSIQFVGGRYSTSDSDEIKFLDGYCEKNPGVVMKIKGNEGKIMGKLKKKLGDSKLNDVEIAAVAQDIEKSISEKDEESDDENVKNEDKPAPKRPVSKSAGKTPKPVGEDPLS